MSAIRLLIVDDHPIMRDGLRGVFGGDEEFEVVGEAGDGAEAIAVAQQIEVDVILMDLRMPAMGGVEAITRLRPAAAPGPGADPHHVRHGPGRAARDRGRRDRLPAQGRTADELIRAVRAAYAGRSVLAPSVASALMGRVGAPPADALTPRELDVLRLVAEGGTNQSVARRLLVSETTIKTHLLHIYAKLGVRDRAAAVSTAYKRGLIS